MTQFIHKVQTQANLRLSGQGQEQGGDQEEATYRGFGAVGDDPALDLGDFLE